MLFIQMITINYEKDRRSGEEMRKINEVRFENIPDNDIDLCGNEYYLHDDRHRKSKVFLFLLPISA